MSNDSAVAITAELVSAYLKNNAVGADDLPQLVQHLPGLISQIHEAFARLPLSQAQAVPGARQGEGVLANGARPVVRPAPIPAVPIAESVTPDHVVCLEDGLTFRSLRPHLVSTHGLTPEAYRQKWGLAHDHPMVAPNYALERSQVARKIGLGRRGRGGQPIPPGRSSEAGRDHGEG
jgi:predicted transcriptional regulator